MRDVCAIVALSQAEIDDFFPGSMWEELKGLMPGAQVTQIPLPQPEDWTRLWREEPAEILVSAWRTPSLNSTLKPSDLTSLRYVCYLAGSVRHLVPRELIENGLLVTNWGDSVSNTVAECTLMLTLMALRRASHWAVAMHSKGGWKDSSTMTQSLVGRRVGIHGFGLISRRLVPMLRPFTSEIQSFSPHVPDEEFSNLGVRRLQSMEELFATSDIVVELAALTPQTYHIVKENHLRSIPEGGVFVNVGRGAVVDEDALVKVAKEGRLQIALDVFEKEPLPKDSPLRGLPNVTLLPHLGGPTRDRRRDAGALALKNIRAYLQGEPMEGKVTLEVYDRSS